MVASALARAATGWRAARNWFLQRWYSRFPPRYAAELLELPEAGDVEFAPAREAGGLVCPVTRLPLAAGAAFYRCRQCNMAYSREGWEFLRRSDKGRCCGCHQRNTVLPASGTQR